MTRIILVRHGFSEANVQHVFAGISDTPLCDIGHHQASAVAAYLCANEKIDKIYTSDLQRVIDTVSPTAKALGLTPIKDAGLREINGGLWEGMPFDDIALGYERDFHTWKHDTANARPTGGESVREVYERIVPHIKRLASENEGKTILLGSHWTTIRALLAYVLTGTHESIGMAEQAPSHGNDASAPTVKNASLHILTYEAGTLTPVKLDITEHLSNLDTNNKKSL